MSKHTPGPWLCADFRATLNGFAHKVWEIVSANNTGICFVVLPDNEYNEENNAEREATARLIAAAPDLLAACEIACAVLDDIYVRESKTSAHGQRVRSDIAENIGFIRAAIAKATGES